ncbi:MAG TPA: hypothetical protein VFB41_09510 [Solirubrobacteraceae bacterium]|nr:hypothetical protein [Solirubrobacteraceae bacterium]
MDLKRFTKKAKDAFDEHGGTDGLKDDVGRAREAVSTPGSIKDKALAVKDALTSRPDDAATADDAPTDAPAAEAPAADDAPSGGQTPPAAA